MLPGRDWTLWFPICCPVLKGAAAHALLVGPAVKPKDPAVPSGSSSLKGRDVPQPAEGSCALRVRSSVVRSPRGGTARHHTPGGCGTALLSLSSQGGSAQNLARDSAGLSQPAAQMLLPVLDPYPKSLPCVSFPYFLTGASIPAAFVLFLRLFASAFVSLYRPAPLPVHTLIHLGISCPNKPSVKGRVIAPSDTLLGGLPLGHAGIPSGMFQPSSSRMRPSCAEPWLSLQPSAPSSSDHSPGLIYQKPCLMLSKVCLIFSWADEAAPGGGGVPC